MFKGFNFGVIFKIVNETRKLPDKDDFIKLDKHQMLAFIWKSSLSQIQMDMVFPYLVLTIQTYTTMQHLTMFHSMTDHIYDDHPRRLS